MYVEKSISRGQLAEVGFFFPPYESPALNSGHHIRSGGYHVRLGGKHLHQLSHLTGPQLMLICFWCNIVFLVANRILLIAMSLNFQRESFALTTPGVIELWLGILLYPILPYIDFRNGYCIRQCFLQRYSVFNLDKICECKWKTLTIDKLSR